MNIIKNGTEYINDYSEPIPGQLEVTFKREPKNKETDCDVCNLGEGKYCKYCDYQGLLPE